MMRFSALALSTAVALVGNLGIALGDCSFDEISLQTTPGFTITIDKEYKILEDTIAKVKYGLYCDSQPKGVDGVDKWFKVPVSSVGVRVPIASGFLEALGHRDALTAADSPGNLTNICLDASKIKSLDSEEQANVDVVFSSDAASDGDKSVRLPTDDSLSPLQKAEWIKFVAAFFNDEKSSDSLFSSISDAYNCHWSNLQNVAQQPHAYWIQYADNNGEPSYNIIDSSYQKSLLAGAGATNDTSKALDDSSDLTKFQNAIKDADFVIDQTNLTEYGKRATEWYSKFGYSDPQNSGVSFLLSRNIWRTDKYTSKSGVSNFPEFGYVRPDLVLQDIISVIEPTYDASHTRRWMLWLGGTNEDTVAIDADNYDCSSPWISSVTKCTARSDFTGSDPDTSDSSEKPDDSDKDNSGSGSSGRTGKIVGGVVGAFVFVVLGIVGLHYFNRHRRNARIQALRQSDFGGEGINLHDARRFS
ncbi:hypothetical protein LPJ58_004020 [Coemansia sp. RSA 1591]|nr:hypothetical protein LPJ58_004020 [Coemansia sp. RSA 1591]